jgi:hypothetical protein
VCCRTRRVHRSSNILQPVPPTCALSSTHRCSIYSASRFHGSDPKRQKKVWGDAHVTSFRFKFVFVHVWHSFSWSSRNHELQPRPSGIRSPHNADTALTVDGRTHNSDSRSENRKNPLKHTPDAACSSPVLLLQPRSQQQSRHPISMEDSRE